MYGSTVSLYGSHTEVIYMVNLEENTQKTDWQPDVKEYIIITQETKILKVHYAQQSTTTYCIMSTLCTHLYCMYEAIVAAAITQLHTSLIRLKHRKYTEVFMNCPLHAAHPYFVSMFPCCISPSSSPGPPTHKHTPIHPFTAQ